MLGKKNWLFGRENIEGKENVKIHFTQKKGRKMRRIDERIV